VSGNLYHIDLSACENRRGITDKGKAFAALRKAIGIFTLARTLTYTLKLIDEHITPKNQAPFMTTTQTGPRDVSAVLILPPAA
jgi:hypothetical protein